MAEPMPEAARKLVSTWFESALDRNAEVQLGAITRELATPDLPWYEMVQTGKRYLLVRWSIHDDEGMPTITECIAGLIAGWESTMEMIQNRQEAEDVA